MIQVWYRCLVLDWISLICMQEKIVTTTTKSGRCAHVVKPIDRHEPITVAFVNVAFVVWIIIVSVSSILQFCNAPIFVSHNFSYFFFFESIGPWINNCVGERNQKYFLQFLVYVGILSIYSVILVISSWINPCIGGNCSDDLIQAQSRM